MNIFKNLVKKRPLDFNNIDYRIVEEKKNKRHSYKYRIYSWITGLESDILCYSGASFIKMLKKYNLGLQTYYDLVVLKLDNIQDRPKCPICSKTLDFISMEHGYKKTCSKECEKLLRKEYINKNSKMLKKGDRQSDAAKIKISKSLIGRKMSDSWKQKRSNYMKKFHASEEGKKFFKNIYEKISKLNIEKILNNKDSYSYNKNFLKGEYFSEIFKENYYFDSGWEQKFIKLSEKFSSDIEILTRATEIITYQLIDKSGEKSSHRYLPDFYIKLKTGEEFIIEIKPFYQLNERKVLAKKEAAELYYSKKRIKYLIITEKEFLNIKSNCKKLNESFDLITYLLNKFND